MTPLQRYAITAILCCLAYLPAQQAVFVKDDLALLLSADSDITSAVTHSWPGGFYRPGAELFFAWQQRFFALAPLPYHLVSLIAHLSAVAIAYLLFGTLGAATTTCFIGATVFALHPLNTESVSWISGQMSLIASLCTLTCLWLAGYPRLSLIVIPVGAIGLGFYEIFAVTPLLLVALYLATGQRRGVPTALALTGLCAAYFYWRDTALDLGSGYYELTASPATGLINLAYYLYLLAGGSAIGGRVIRYQPEQIGTNFFDVFTPLLICNLLLSVVALITLWREGGLRRLPAAGLIPALWILLSLLPALLLDERPRRLAYISVPGYALAVGQVLTYLHEKTRSNPLWAGTGTCSVILVLMLTLYARIDDWR